MPYVTLGQVPHYYEWVTAEGEGAPTGKPVMVFVHGWGGSGRYWQTTAQALSPDYDCLLYDLRGFGRSTGGEQPQDPRDPSYALEVYAEELVALLDHWSLGTVTLNAHSMGASMAVLFAQRFGDRLQQLILTCSGIFQYNPVTFNLFHLAGSGVVALRPQWLTALPGMEHLFMARFVHRPLPSAVSGAFLADYVMATGVASRGTIYTAVSRHASEVMPGAFGAIAVPTLLVAGQKDQIIPPRLAKQAAALNDHIQYVEIPKVGHFPMLEQADTYLGLVRNFLAASAVPATHGSGESPVPETPSV